MSINLLDILKNQVADQLVSGASGFLGESESGTRSAVNAILPTLLGSVAQKASTESGAASLLGLLKDGGHDGSILNNLSGLFGGGSNTDSLMSSGSGILKAVLGDKLGSIVDWVASFSGIRQGSASSLMGMAAPLLMGLLGKQVKNQGLNASGLMSLLGGQSDFIKAAAPAGISSLLGFSGLSSATAAAKQVSHTVTETTRQTVEEGGNFFGKLLPWLGLLLLLGLLFYFLRGCGKKTADVVTDAVETTTAAVDTAATVATDAASAVGKFFSKKLSSGFELIGAAETGVESQLVTFIEDNSDANKQAMADKKTWFNFDRLLFETGSATLKPESQEQLKNVAEILKAFPTVEIKVGGYTDNVGNPAANKKLSADRASNVKAELVKLGVDAKRMSAEGYGEEHPVASKMTQKKAKHKTDVSLSA
ncbi:MAG: OmpA family protein [Saprospiraceae bacterium]